MKYFTSLMDYSSYCSEDKGSKGSSERPIIQLFPNLGAVLW